MPTPIVTDEDGYHVYRAWASAGRRVLARLDHGVPSGNRGAHGIAICIDPGDYMGRHRALPCTYPVMVGSQLVRVNPPTSAA